MVIVEDDPDFYHVLLWEAHRMDQEMADARVELDDAYSRKLYL